MDAMMLLRTFAAATTIIAAALVAANWNARVMSPALRCSSLLPSPGWRMAG